jgi:hypothetical protein
MLKKLSEKIAIGCFLGAFFTQLEHYIMYGHVWDWEQVMHHETLALIFIFLGIGVLIGSRIRK